MGDRDDDSRVFQRALIALILQEPDEVVAEVDQLIRRASRAVRAVHVSFARASGQGKHDDLPEQAFYMVGTIEDAVRKAEQLRSQ